jgi:hypothetical protein
MFNYALLTSADNLIVAQISQDASIEYKKMTFDDFESDSIDILFIGELEDELLNQVAKYMHQFPIMPQSKTDITEENFVQLSFEQAQNLHMQIFDSWIINNNVSLIEELYVVTDNLKKLWHSDRVTFFEEFWYLVKRNLGSKELTLIFNDIEKSENPNVKDKLTQSKITGRNISNFEKGAEIEQKLMDHYKANFSSYLELLDFNQEKSELVLTAQIANSPVLIMAKTPNVNQLQITLLKTLIEGISKST